jgi:hypothetical protein
MAVDTRPLTPSHHAHAYPVHVEATDHPAVSRWLWLVKWLLAIPHYVVLLFLWVAFVVLSIVAMVAIVFTGRYPRAIFDFNVGVMRWSWRVTYYSYGALATDQYPPFSLEDDPAYPVHLSVDYPEHLSRGLALVKWWLLALPHYVVVGLFLGSGAWVAYDANGTARWIWGSGLVGILVLVAAVAVLFTGAYPRPVYDLVLGLHRWGLRVAAYAALMTDEYPPFRLDQGPHEPSAVVLSTGESPPPPPPAAAGAPPSSAAAQLTYGAGQPFQGAGQQPYAPVPPLGVGSQPGPAQPAGPPPTRWTGGRVVTLVAGTLVGVVSLSLLAGGASLLVADQVVRNSDNYVMSSTTRVSSAGSAVLFEDVKVDAPAGWVPERILGDVRIVVTPVRPEQQVFIGVGPQRDVDAYLDDAAYTVYRGAKRIDREVHGTAEPAAPTSQQFWDAAASGHGRQQLQWTLRTGEWAGVVMNADGTAGVDADIAVGATFPGLLGIAVGMLVGGGLLAVVGGVMIALATRRPRAPAR